MAVPVVEAVVAVIMSSFSNVGWCRHLRDGAGLQNPTEVWPILHASAHDV
jgi:hypothetical protein